MDNLNADRALVHVEDVFRFAVHQLETVSLDASLKLAFDRSLPEVVQVLLGAKDLLEEFRASLFRL
jgi:hypothetical protein